MRFFDKQRCRSPPRWPPTSRSASATSPRCSPRPIPTGDSCSPAPRQAHRHQQRDVHGARRQRHDLRPLNSTGSAGTIYYQNLPSCADRARLSSRHAAAGSLQDAPVLRGRGRRQAAAVHVPGPAIHDHLGGEPPGHPGRRAVRRERRRSADEGTDVGAARRCSSTTTRAAATTTTSRRRRRSSPTTSRRSRSRATLPRQLRPLRLPGAVVRRLPVGEGRLRLEHRPGPHLGRWPSSSASGTCRR